MSGPHGPSGGFDSGHRGGWPAGVDPSWGGSPLARPEHYGYGDPHATGPVGGSRVGGGPSGSRGRSRWPWLSGAGAAVAVGAAVVWLCVAAWATPVFDQQRVQGDVASLLRDSYGVAGLGPVRCPAEQPVVAGSRFQCQVVVEGQARQVTLVVRDQHGRYAVGHPQ